VVRGAGQGMDWDTFKPLSQTPHDTTPFILPLFVVPAFLWYISDPPPLPPMAIAPVLISPLAIFST